ncbi:MAG: hypothetical protein ACLTZY_07555 [Alistipes indistinctus]
MKRNFYSCPCWQPCLWQDAHRRRLLPGGEDNGNGEANTSYMAVNLMSSDVTGTRAAAGYEDGSEAENDVEKVRFIFSPRTAPLLTLNFKLAAM